MKCIHCGNDSTYPVRQSNSGRCGTCLHPFAFEPKSDPNTVSDGLFQKVIKDVSADGTLAFTERQLWYEFNRRLISKLPYVPPAFGVGAAVCAAGGILAGVIVNPAFIALGIVGAIVSGVVGTQVGKKTPRKKLVKVPFEQFRMQYLQRYQETHGKLERLIPPVVARPGTASSVSLPPDVTAYSFDRALITQDAETAAMLVANRFHFENNCAILSSDRRYPQNGLFDTILGMLRRNPQLLVFVLHDASVSGLSVAARMRGETWFADTPARIYDLGLRPKHAMSGNFILTNTLLAPEAGGSMVPPDVAASLQPDEVKWLTEGHVAQVDCIRPARLMRAIYQGFARANEMVDYDDTGGIIFLDTGPGVYVYDGTGTGVGGSEVYASDSFG